MTRIQRYRLLASIQASRQSRPGVSSLTKRAFAQLAQPLETVPGIAGVSLPLWDRQGVTPVHWCVIPASIARMWYSYDLAVMGAGCFRSSATQYYDHPRGWVLFVSEDVPVAARLVVLHAAVSLLILDPPSWHDAYQGYWSRFNY